MKYIVQKSETIAGGWVCTDTEHGGSHELDRGLIQHDVATALGCSKQNYQRFEAGKESPSLRMLAEVCDVLGLTLYVTGDDKNWGK